MKIRCTLSAPPLESSLSQTSHPLTLGIGSKQPRQKSVESRLPGIEWGFSFFCCGKRGTSLFHHCWGLSLQLSGYNSLRYHTATWETGTSLWPVWEVCQLSREKEGAVWGTIPFKTHSTSFSYFPKATSTISTPRFPVASHPESP